MTDLKQIRVETGAMRAAIFPSITIEGAIVWGGELVRGLNGQNTQVHVLNQPTPAHVVKALIQGIDRIEGELLEVRDAIEKAVK